MFFGNPELLQRNLHNDLNTLIKNVKAREDQYLTVLQYNKTLISNNSNVGEHIPFFNEQLNKHRSFLTSSLSVHEKMLIQQDQIKQKYSCAMSGDQNIVKLLGRVTARVLEICQASMEKGKFLDSQLMEKYSLFKVGLLSSLNQGGKINIQTVLDAIIDYIVGKDKKQIQRLQQILKLITDGEFLKLGQIYTFAKQQQKKPTVSTPILQKKQSYKPILNSLQKSKQKSPQKHNRQEQIRIQNEKIKKKKTKVTKQLITNVYSIMDLSKQQFTEDFTFTLNPQQKRRRLYDEIFSRNKFNYEQIMDFQAKKDQFLIKVKQFKERMELQSKKIQQALVVVINKPIEPKPIDEKTPTKVVQRKQTKSDVDQNQHEQSISPERVERIFRRRQKKQPVKAQSPRFIKQVPLTSLQSTQDGFQHIKFDVKNQEVFTRSNRARLPQIPGRSSLDNRYERKNDSRIGSDPKKDQKRVSIMKNVQIGTLHNNTAKNSFLEGTSTSNRKSPRDRSIGEPLFQNLPTGNVNLNANGLNGLDFTFYVRKKVNKFYETRNNFVL